MPSQGPPTEEDNDLTPLLGAMRNVDVKYFERTLLDFLQSYPRSVSDFVRSVTFNSMGTPTVANKDRILSLATNDRHQSTLDNSRPATIVVVSRPDADPVYCRDEDVEFLNALRRMVFFTNREWDGFKSSSPDELARWYQGLVDIVNRTNQ